MKNLLSLDWFKSAKKRELENLIIEGQKLQNSILEKELESKKASSSLYRKLKLVGDVLTIVLNDGSIVSKSGVTKEDFDKVRLAQSEYEILSLIKTPDPNAYKNKAKEETEKVEFEVVKKAIEGFDILKSASDFVVENGSVYMKDAKGNTIQRSLPALLVTEFANLVTTLESENISLSDSVGYQSLKKFWLKCCLNPNAQSAEDLYTFLTHHQFKIDKHGNFYAYRNVVSGTESKNKELVDFVSNTYNKVKAVWKKKPINFGVFSRLGEYKLIEYGKQVPKDDNPYWEQVGSLEELYKNLSTMQEKNYTDAHTNSFDYKVGTVISMPRFDGDDNNGVSCSKGFHAASKKYDYSGFGDTSILVIINPMDVLAVPLGEVGKLRTCRWFFASVLSKEERHILDDNDFDVTDLGDQFEEECQKDMQNYVQNSFAEEVKRHTFQLPKITNREISGIVNSLEAMKESISKRVSEI
jgi:hypothetical protein